MRILHVLDHSLPLQSGYTFRTASILREQRALGWETFHVTTPRHQSASGDVEDAAGWRFHRTHLAASASDRWPGVRYAREMAATTRRLDELIESLRPDVLHAHSPALDALPALRAGRRHRLPVVYEVRALWEDAAVDLHRVREGGVRYRLTRALETHVLRRVGQVVTICEGLRADIAARGIPASRITVVPNAVDAEAFALVAPPDPALRSQLGLDGMDVVGFAGSFYAYEGLDTLIDAAAQLAASRPRLRILLVGGGPEDAALRARAAARGVADRVVFTGRVPHDDVQRYYALVDILAYPRRRIRLTELVTPLKPLEAMALGRIVVASDVGGHRELVRDGSTGFLFPAGDAGALAAAIAGALERRDDWPRTLEAARRFVVEERTWKRSVARYADVYGAVLGSGRAAAAARAEEAGAR